MHTKSALKHEKEVTRLKRQIESKTCKFIQAAGGAEKQTATKEIIFNALVVRQRLRTAQLTATRAKSLSQLRLRDVKELNAKLRAAVDAYEAASAKATE